VSTKPSVNEAAVIAFRDAAEFEAWLDEHVDLRAGVWLKIAKKGSLTDDEAVDLGLCYGWIAGQRKSYDEVYYLQKCSELSYETGQRSIRGLRPKSKTAWGHPTYRQRAA
jgi:uncharacterized protein YdeI (YjbR/CyaY-like superfamily)